LAVPTFVPTYSPTSFYDYIRPPNISELLLVNYSESYVIVRVKVTKDKHCIVYCNTFLE
jgi:hypothetical protein